MNTTNAVGSKAGLVYHTGILLEKDQPKKAGLSFQSINTKNKRPQFSCDLYKLNQECL